MRALTEEAIAGTRRGKEAEEKRPRRRGRGEEAEEKEAHLQSSSRSQKSSQHTQMHESPPGVTAPFELIRCMKSA